MKIIAELFEAWLQWAVIEQVSSMPGISHFYIKIHHESRLPMEGPLNDCGSSPERKYEPLREIKLSVLVI
jgi:hypothetical protein